MMTPQILFQGTFEPHITDLLPDIVKRGDHFVDIGANIGWYTVRAGKLVGQQGRVTAFEPLPQTFSLLHRNLFINGLTAHVTAVPCALGEIEEHVSLHFLEDFWGSPLLEQPGDDYAQFLQRTVQTCSVEMTTLDAYLDRNDSPKVDVIKIDVEGAENRVLAGMSQTLAKNPEIVLLCELWTSSSEKREFMKQFLHEHEFPVRYISKKGKLISSDIDNLPQPLCDLYLARK
jgi:FkbM family methyltransferase